MREIHLREKCEKAAKTKTDKYATLRCTHIFKGESMYMAV